MAIENMIGKWLSGSGWTELFFKTEIASSGRSETLLKSSHVKRTRYAHEVSIAALYILRNNAYRDNQKTAVESLETWVARRCKESAQFLFWQTTIILEGILLNFVRSIRTSDFCLFVQMLEELCPWLFALDLIHYSRWLPVFIKGLKELPVRHPQVYEAFQKGHFTSRKTNADFSAISDDQLHEQNNKLIKGCSGAINNLHNNDALLKWMVAGPEISRMIHDYDQIPVHNLSNKVPNRCHHECSASFQSRYISHVSKMVKYMQEDGNPFSEQLLQTIDNQKILMSQSAENSVRQAEQKGIKQYENFVKERLIFGQKSFYDSLSKNNLELFHGPKKTYTMRTLGRNSNYDRILVSRCGRFGRNTHGAVWLSYHPILLINCC
ncbi:hypothetical protein HELRODRAFT_184084 [Helobdella robusta]|uniref:Uncharacterized protein n=1 Tax=Helobdella robusta TaxID=6412 RepID=T1FKJ7_HELRO|nr:hypothetical protein HELRODRAFT_184084 [Helobdella robusta]ESO08278.1 hypothetical protein HELRODRAFT_184084 [Helobdella robusta]